MFSKNKQSKPTSKYKIVGLVLLLTVLGVFTGWFYFRSQAPNPASDDNEMINYDPPSNEEKSAGDLQKEQIVKEQERSNEASNPETEDDKKSVDVIISDAGQYDSIIEVRSFVPGHIKDGTCTLSFTKGIEKLAKQTPARGDVSSTICLNPNIKRSEFPGTGTWKLIVSYESSDATGKSNVADVKIE